MQYLTRDLKVPRCGQPNLNRCFSVRACSGSLIRQLSYAMVDSRLLIQPINDSRFYSTAEVSFLTTESHNNCQSESPLNRV